MAQTSASPAVAPPGPAPFPDMVWIPGGTFQMGSEEHYPEERPVHRVTVDGFWMDRTPVTNAAFPAVRRRDKHVTFAEIPPNPADYPGAKKELLHPGSLVFVKPPNPVDLGDFHNWWRFVLGADWRHPRGPNSTIKGREDHPVTHVTFGDAEAYARVGRQGSSDRSGMGVRRARWPRRRRIRLGQRARVDGKLMANFWQGEFPWQNLKEDGFEGTSPVGAFPPNGYGLVDVTGNVWEWTTDWYTPKHPDEQIKACCIPQNPRGGAEAESSIRVSPTSGFRARSSKVGRIYARRTTVEGIDPPRASPSRSTRPRVIWVSVASSGRERNCRGVDETDARAMHLEIARAWSVLLIRGICNVLFALVAFLQPELTLVDAGARVGCLCGRRRRDGADDRRRRASRRRTRWSLWWLERAGSSPASRPASGPA